MITKKLVAPSEHVSQFSHLLNRFIAFPFTYCVKLVTHHGNMDSYSPDGSPEVAHLCHVGPEQHNLVLGAQRLELRESRISFLSSDAYQFCLLFISLLS